MNILGIESSCDETAAAVVADGRILSDPVASQIKLHAEYGGVVPELAAREHLSNILPVARQAIDQSGIRLGELTGLPPLKGRDYLRL